MLRDEAPAGLSDDASTPCLSDMLTAAVYAITTESDPSSVAVETTAKLFGIDKDDTTAFFERIKLLSLHTLSEMVESVTLAEFADAKRCLDEGVGRGSDYGQKPNFRGGGVMILCFVAFARMEKDTANSGKN